MMRVSSITGGGRGARQASDLACAGDGAGDALAALVLVDERLGGVGGDRAVELVVDLDHRREVARRDALDLFDGDVGDRPRSGARGASSSSGPRFTRQLTFVHTDTISLPTGSRLNIV